MTINTYNLKDTGYANTAADGTQESEIANSGSALPIYVDSLTWNRKTGTNSNPNPGVYEDTEINFVSISNPAIAVSGVLDSADSNYATQLAALDDMCVTKGLKLFYYSSTSDGYKPITAVKGSATFGSLQVDGTTKALLVRALSFNLTESNNNATKGLRRYTLMLEVTNPRAIAV